MTTIADLAIQFSGNVGPLAASVAQAKSEVSGFSSHVEQTSAKMYQSGARMSLAVTTPLVGLAGTALNAAAGFEQSMNVMQEVSGSTGAQMDKMREQAISLGATTSFSAGEAAQGLLELAKAGMTAEQASASIGGVLNLAAAGGLSVASSAEIAANAINTFGLEASEMPNVADLMAAAANNSSIEISDLALAFQASSAVFASNSQGIDTLSTAISLLGNNGLKSSDAGTSLKTMLMSLTSPTEAAAADLTALGVTVYDAAGNMRLLPDILGDMEKGLASYTQEQRQGALTTIFGSDAIRAANILLKEGSQGWEKMASSLGQQGTAANVANARMKGLGGAFEYFKGSVESAMIGAALPWTTMLSEMIRWIGDLISSFGQLSPEVQQFAVIFGVAAAAVGPLLIGLSMMLPAITAIGAGLAMLASPFALVIGGFAALIALDVGGIGTLFGDLGRYFAAVVEDGDTLNDWLTHLPEWMQPAVEWTGRFVSALADLAGGGSLTAFGEELSSLFSFDFSALGESLSSAWATVKESTTTAWASVSESISSAWATAQPIVAEFTTSGAWATASGEISASLSTIGEAITGAFSGDVSLATLRDTLVTEAMGIGTALQEVLKSGAFATLQTDLLAAFNLSELPAQIATGVEAAKAALQPLIDYLTPAFERVQTTFSELGTYFANIGTQMAPLQEAAISLGAAISGVFAGDGSGSPSTAAMWLQGALTMLAGAFALVLNVVNGLASAIEPLVSGVLAELTTVMNGLALIVSGLSTGINALVTGDTTAAWNGFKTALQGVADIITGTLSNAFTVISGLLTALGTTITTTLSDWGFDKAAASAQIVIDKIISISETIANITSGEISLSTVAPEWITDLMAWDFPPLVWPELPEWKWPSMPTFSWPSMPTWEWPSMPTFTWPTMPTWEWPSWPEWEWPKLPGILYTIFGGEEGNALGTSNWKGGTTWVGERGPELVNLPQGSRIYSNSESEAMVSSPMGGGVTVYATVNSLIDVEDLAYRVLEVIGRN